tara:strand:- start:535 stop:645 length:111 start_codon:yes stop_codon:yes gene_type:complete
LFSTGVDELDCSIDNGSSSLEELQQLAGEAMEVLME